MWKVTLEDDRLVFTPFFGEPAADQDPDQCLAEYQKFRERYEQYEMDLQNRDEEIQDLKLENDRLQRREKLSQEFINFFDCYDRLCSRCTQYCPDDVVKCKMSLVQHRHELINEYKKKLEEIG